MSRPLLRDLLLLAWPVVVSRATQTIVGLSDSLMVAHLGDEALAATTTGAMNTFLVLVLPMGTVFIVQSFAAQLFGRGDLVGARRYAVYGLAIALATEALALGSLPLVGAVLGWFPYEGGVHAEMTEYLQLRLLSAGPAIGLEALGAYYGGLGRTTVPMVASVVAMVINVAFNWVLIDGHLGAPRLGVAGAAVASSIGTTTAFVGLFAYFASAGAIPRPRARELVRVLRFGVPNGLNWLFEFSAWALFLNVVVAGLGTTALAALMAVMQINSVSFMPAFGLASAGAILVGQAIGKDDRDDVPRVVRMTWLTGTAYQCAIALAYLFAPALLFSPFAAEPGSRAALMELGVRMLMISSAWQLFDSAAMVVGEALRAAGDTLWPLIFRIALAWILFVPGSWVAVVHFDGGDVAAMVALVLYIGALALLLYARFRSGRWRTMELTEPTVL